MGKKTPGYGNDGKKKERLSHEHDEAAWHWTSSFAVFLNGHPHQLREQRLGEVTYLWMLSHHCSERAPVPTNTQCFPLCLSFHQTAQLIEDLDPTSSEATAVYGKIGRACTLADERSGRLP